MDKYLIVGYADQLVLISDTPPLENTVFCNIAIYPFPLTGQDTLHTGYYLPTLKTQATFNAFFYDADKNQAMVLQVTVSPMHSVTEKGFEQLKKWGVQSAHYLAVTGLHATFDLPVPLITLQIIPLECTETRGKNPPSSPHFICTYIHENILRHSRKIENDGTTSKTPRKTNPPLTKPPPPPKRVVKVPNASVDTPCVRISPLSFAPASPEFCL